MTAYVRWELGQNHLCFHSHFFRSSAGKKAEKTGQRKCTQYNSLLCHQKSGQTTVQSYNTGLRFLAK